MTAKKQKKARRPAIGKRLVDSADFNVKLAHIAMGVTEGFIRSLEYYGYEIRPLSPKRKEKRK